MCQNHILPGHFKAKTLSYYTNKIIGTINWAEAQDNGKNVI
jgi:hypothetical protein